MLKHLKSLIGHRNPLRLLWHRSKALAAATRFMFPARHLTVIGITGTDGKTTTVGMVAHILRAAGRNVGALSTASFQINDDIQWNATQKTSPSPTTLQRFLRRLVDAGCTHAVLEYSSHGLVQGRTLFTRPAVTAITNTSPEHLDYHGTLQQYRADKGLLFTMLHGKGTKVLNAGDATYVIYREIPSEHTIVYASKDVGLRTSDRVKDRTYLWLRDVTISTNRTSATVHRIGSQLTAHSSQLTLSIPGAFNLENALCAIGCAMSCGIALKDCCEALASFPGVPGRMERIDEGQPFSVYVDFTVTPASYERTLSTLKQTLRAGGRLLVLTGSCGDRMREKRPLIGRIVSTYADVVVVTNEDPYTEDPAQIIDEVWAGIDPSKTKAHRIFERREAIVLLLKEAQPGDTVILCGKGSDTTMWVKEEKIPWNEREIVRETLRAMKNTHD